MPPNPKRICGALQLFVLVLTLPILASGQEKYVPSRITGPVDEAKLTLLRGNTYPLARPESDRGPTPPALPMERMLLVLKRSPEQEAALRELLDEQQDQSSPNYHKWLTPEQFGRQFGPSDLDIQTVTSWLESHGFQIAQVTKGRTVIEFSGTAAQVQDAFHTVIHKYVVNGEEHWANASDPEIPAALTPVVLGVATLHNFRKRPNIRISDKRIAAKLTPGPHPQVTFSDGTHALGPADYAVIYNIQPLYNMGINGTGTTIAVVGRSNFNVQDVRDFRNLFALPPNDPQIIMNGPDPGDLGGGEELEAVLDASWSGAVAPGATVKFVLSSSTNTTDGVDLSAVYIVDNNLANVMTESFGLCEALTTAADAANLAAIAGQAAAEGITYMASTGDSGAEGCDDPNATQAIGQISVGFPASLPYLVAVGGTMFNEHGNDAAFWKSTNSPGTFESAISYIPESVWNESCSVAQCGQNANLAAGGGGASGTNAKFSFPKPVWQTGLPGIPVDGKRDLPDVSLTAALHDGYLLCLDASCQPNQGGISVFLVGGTSASSPSFAGIMALVNQKIGSRQGQADYVLYRLAAGENLSQCNASSISGLPAGNCVFNDVTVGSNAVPGETGFGTSTAKYQSNLGYDLASGLGSVNAANLVNQWGTVRINGTTTTLTLMPSAPTTIAHGTSANVNITVAAKTSGTGTPSGNVSLLTSNGQAVDFFALNNGSVSSTTSRLPGGTYTVTAHYSGDSIFAPGDSSPTSVTVSPEVSFTSMKVLTADANGNPIPFTTGPYGSFVYLRADVRSLSGNGTATGSVNFADNGNTPNVPGDPYPLNSEGNTATLNGVFTFSAGPHSLVAQYTGDPSFNPSNSLPVNFTITQGPTTTSVTSSASPIPFGTPVTLTSTVSTNSFGNPPTGTVTFFLGTTQLGSSVAVTGRKDPQTGLAMAAASLTTSSLPPGQDSVTAQYSGDSSYAASTSGPVVISVTGPQDFKVTANPATIIVTTPGAPGVTTLTIAGQNGFSGTIALSSASCSNLPPETGCNFNPPSVTGSGTTTLTIVTTAPHNAMTIATAPHNGPGWWMASGGAALVCVFLLGATPRRCRRNAFLGLIALFFLTTFAACGGGGGSRDPGTPIGQRTVTVTLTSGTISHTVDLTLTIR